MYHGAARVGCVQHGVPVPQKSAADTQVYTRIGGGWLMAGGRCAEPGAKAVRRTGG